jgi:hypothetical protein
MHPRRVHKRILGVDFSGANDAGRKIWIAEGQRQRGNRLKLIDLRPACDLPCSGVDPRTAIAALAAHIVRDPDTIAGFDFPFALPLPVIDRPSWDAFVQDFAERFPDPDAFRQWALQRAGGRELRRAADREAKTPFNSYNLRIYRQTWWGIAHLLGPLVARGLAIVRPFHPTPREPRPILIEACPASSLKSIDFYPAYKGRTGVHRQERKAVLQKLIAIGAIERPTPAIERRILDNSGGDALDAVIAAIAAAHSKVEEDIDPSQRIEGRIYFALSSSMRRWRLPSSNTRTSECAPAWNLLSGDVLGFVRRVMHPERVVSVEALNHLQRTWTRLVMSGKPNGLAEKPGLLASLERVGGEFNKLRAELLSALEESRGRETAVELGTRAQISIDILIRNLFERTADVGFLAEDGAIIDSLAAGENADLEGLRQRLEEYVAKYSVYDDIAVFRPDGTLHVTRLGAETRFGADDRLIAAALSQPGTFQEIFRAGPDGAAQLLYVQSIPGPSRAPIGVLALSFKFDDEMRGIFGSLLKGTSPGVILGVVDCDGHVIASSDGGGLAIGARLDLEAEKLVTLTLGETEYLGLRRPTRGYQGFVGLGWSGVALRPAVLRQTGAAAAEAEPAEEHDERTIAASAVVSDALKQISRRAYAIDSDLHLIGLNGKIAADRENNRVLPAVLGSIREVGEQIRNAVHSVIGALYDQTHGSLRREAEQMAALGVDIMDRNLYERANDNRWWALTPTFRTTLAAGTPSPGAAAEIGRILAHINGLYTVYSTLFVFDATGRVVADSRNGASGLVGEKLSGAHIEEALSGRNTQAYSVSGFEPTPLYDGRPTYIYCGSILAPDFSRTVGGVAIVFDGEPQFRQMLLDVLPVADSGAPYSGSFAAFVNAKGTVISSTDPAHVPGGTLNDEKLARFQIVARGRSPGYREFKTSDGYSDPITCIVAIPG